MDGEQEMAKVIQFKKQTPKRICLYCNKEKDDYKFDQSMNEYYHKESNTILDYSPCRECGDKWKKSIPIIEMTRKPLFKDMPFFATGVDAYPTGRCIGLTEDIFGGKAEKGQPLLMIEKDYQEIIDRIDGEN